MASDPDQSLKVCPHCGTTTAIGATTCGKCWRPLPITSVPFEPSTVKGPASSSSADEWESDRHRFCPKCGTQSVAGFAFCGTCGNSLAKTPLAAEASTTTPGVRSASTSSSQNHQATTKQPLPLRRHSAIRAVGTIVVALFAIIFGIGVWINTNDQSFGQMILTIAGLLVIIHFLRRWNHE